MGFGDYSDYTNATKGASFLSLNGNNNTVQKKGQPPQFIDFNAKEEAVKASQMSTVDMMSYLNKLSMDKKEAISKELMPLIENPKADPKDKARFKLMLDILKTSGVDVQKVSKYTTTKAVESVTKGMSETVMPGMQVAEEAAVAANLTSVPEGDVIGAEFSKLFQVA